MTTTHTCTRSPANSLKIVSVIAVSFPAVIKKMKVNSLNSVSWEPLDMTQIWCSPLYVSTNVPGENVGHAAISNLPKKKKKKKEIRNHPSLLGCITESGGKMSVCIHKASDSVTVMTVLLYLLSNMKHNVSFENVTGTRNGIRRTNAVSSLCLSLLLSPFIAISIHKKKETIFLNESLLYNEIAPAA